MTRLWLRIAIATVAIVATLVVAVDTFVIRPAADESARAAATAAATEATLVAQLVRRGEVPPGTAIVRMGRAEAEAASGSAPIGDGRFVQVPLRDQGTIVEALWRGLLLVIGTAALAGAGWALWIGAFALFIAFATLYPNAVMMFDVLAKWAALILLRPCRRKLRRSSTSLASSTDSEQRWLSRCYRRPNSSASWRTIYAAH